ncbi:MAG TPA: DUF4265 domain-containing protein [Kofleriaceae bacterium]|nr:DUF4265 domain-containing protein [Kofleriaceae bacterium]
MRLVFVLEAGAWHGNATERLWAEPLGKNRYRLRNSPFYAFGVSNEDIVLGEEVEGQVQFKNAIFPGGHSTYRLKLQASRSSNPSFNQAWEPLGRLGCSYEEGPVLSVDVPPAADIYAVYELLQAGERSGVWDFEEGHCGHPLRKKSE